MNIELTEPQIEYIEADCKYPAMVAGFGAGKTEAAIFRSIFGLIRTANDCNNDQTKQPFYPVRGFYAPTFDLIRVIAWPRFEAVLERLGIDFTLQKSPLNRIIVHGVGEILFRSMENPSRIIGYEHCDADVDELDTLKLDDAADVWRMILARNRQYKPNGELNTIGTTTTPEGFRFVYQTWKQNPKEGYEIIQAPTESNPYLPEDYIDSLKQMYPSNLLDAYLYGQFVNLQSGTVYSSYDRKVCRSEETIRAGEPLYIGCDFNVLNQAATIFVQRQGVWHGVAELTKMKDTPRMIEKIQEDYQSKGHAIYVYPDASGAATKSVNASISDLALLEEAGFTVRANKANPRIKDRIAAMNAALEYGRVKINPVACPVTADCLEQQTYKNGEPDKSSGHDHQNDATTYPIAYTFPIKKRVSDVPFAFAV
jgi:hypothetical protein